MCGSLHQIKSTCRCDGAEDEYSSKRPRAITEPFPVLREKTEGMHSPNSLFDVYICIIPEIDLLCGSNLATRIGLC
jgi:hypothetical protein